MNFQEETLAYEHLGDIEDKQTYAHGFLDGAEWFEKHILPLREKQRMEAHGPNDPPALPQADYSGDKDRGLRFVLKACDLWWDGEPVNMSGFKWQEVNRTAGMIQKFLLANRKVTPAHYKQYRESINRQGKVKVEYLSEDWVDFCRWLENEGVI